MTPPGQSDFNPVKSMSDSDAKPSEMDSPSTEDMQSAPKNEMTLDPDMEEDAGLTDAEDGAIATGNVKIRKTGGKWMVMSLQNVVMKGDTDGMAEEKMDDDDSKPMPAVKSPKDLGMDKFM